jgi:branched-chain amino acid transport system substrate-binding protein
MRSVGRPWRSIWWPVLFAIALAVAACGGSDGTTTETAEPRSAPDPTPATPPPAPKAIRLAVVGAHTGDLATLGMPTLRAARLAVAEVNRRGGVFSREIEIVARDDQCDPGRAEPIAQELMAEGISMILGHTCSGATRAALSVYDPERVVVISPSATNPALTEGGAHPGFFRTISPDDAQARLQARFVVAGLESRKVAVLHDGDDYGRGLAEYVRRFIDESGRAEVVLFTAIEPGATDYPEAVAAIGEAGADVVIYGGYYPEAARLVRGMRTAGLTIPFVSDDGVKDQSFITAAGEYAEGIYATGPQDTSDRALAKAVIAAHQRDYGTPPGPFYLNAYAAVLVLVNAIEKSGSLDYDSVTRFLRISYVATPLGTIKFDRAGDVSGYGFSIYQVQNGAFAEMMVPDA